MYELWNARIDLQQTFNLMDGNGRGNYLSWFIQDGGKQAGFDDLSIEAARVLAGSVGDDSRRQHALEPWKPLSSMFFKGNSLDVENWLADPVPIQIIMHGAGVYVPRILALLWEGRPDLASHFALQTEAEFESYLSWCITRGVLEKNVPIKMIGARLAAYLGGTEGRGRDQALPPATRLIRLVQGDYKGPFRELIRKSPEDVRSQIAVILWLCGRARKDYDWPKEMLKSLVDWLQAPSEYACQSVWIPNLMFSCYRLRTDVQEAYKVWTPEGSLHVVAWYIVYGSAEFGLHPDLVAPTMLEWLAQPGLETDFALTNFEYLVWLIRPDVNAAYDIKDARNILNLHKWFLNDGAKDETLHAWLDTLGLLSPPQQKDIVSCSVCLSGLWGLTSGRGEDIRLTAAGLTFQGIEFIVFDRRSEKFFSAEGEEINVDPSAVKINIVHLNADTALWDYIYLNRAGLTHAYTIGYWAWELERLPLKWNFAYTFYNEIWAATRFARDAFARGDKRDVLLMPMAVDMPQACATVTRADFGLAEDEFVFYYGFDFRSYMARKNPEAAMKAFLRAFGDTRKKVRLFIKTLAADRASDNFTQKKALADCDPRIVILDRDLSRPELYALISQCDCFVSPHRSEGFGRGPAEAMLLGVPVIATNYSGNTDFTTPETALVIDYDLVPVADGEYPGGEEQFWADIRVDDLAAAMRKLVDEPETCKKLSEAGRKFMTDHHDVSVISATHAIRIKAFLSSEPAEKVVIEVEC
jgi:glycosyltransferase involved in cell wall biosynthesis